MFLFIRSTSRCNLHQLVTDISNFHFIFLTNLVAPRFIVPPNTVYALKGQTAILECKPESNPPATITWLRNGESLAGTGNQYRVNNVEPEDEGSYTCKARNSRGSTQQVVDVKIGGKLGFDIYCMLEYLLSNGQVVIKSTALSRREIYPMNNDNMHAICDCRKTYM